MEELSLLKSEEQEENMEAYNDSMVVKDYQRLGSHLVCENNPENSNFDYNSYKNAENQGQNLVNSLFLERMPSGSINQQETRLHTNLESNNTTPTNKQAAVSFNSRFDYENLYNNVRATKIEVLDDHFEDLIKMEGDDVKYETVSNENSLENCNIDNMFSF